MIEKSVQARTGATKAEKASKDPQAPIISAFGLEKGGSWKASRKLARPINLERRARFARINMA